MKWFRDLFYIEGQEYAFNWFDYLLQVAAFCFFCWGLYSAFFS